MSDKRITPGFSFSWWNTDKKRGCSGFKKTLEQAEAKLAELDLREARRLEKKRLAEEQRDELAKKIIRARPETEARLAVLVRGILEQFDIEASDVWWIIHDEAEDHIEQGPFDIVLDPDEGMVP